MKYIVYRVNDRKILNLVFTDIDQAMAHARRMTIASGNNYDFKPIMQIVREPAPRSLGFMRFYDMIKQGIVRFYSWGRQ
jgi:hypothetical protein